MNFRKRVIISLSRRPSKMLILVLLVFILGTVIIGAAVVAGAISNTDANLRRQMRPVLSASIDWQTEAGYLPFYQLPALTPEHVHAIGNLPYVATYDYANSIRLDSFELKNYHGEDMIVSRPPRTPESFSLLGSSRTDFFQLEQGIIELVTGRTFLENELIPSTDQSVAIVSEAFANVNNLSIGSTFKLSQFVFFPLEAEQFFTEKMFADENIYARIEIELLIIGLYDVPATEATWGVRGTRRADSLQQIYVPSWAIEDVRRRTTLAHISLDPEHAGFFDILPTVTPLFMLEDPADMADFRMAAEPLLPDYFAFADLMSTFDDIAPAMLSLQNIANGILYAAIGATLLVLSLLITLFLYDRRHEIGVYLALGEKKAKIMAQILLEVLITSFIGISLAVFTGHFISNIISQNMLRNEFIALTEERGGDVWAFDGEWTILDSIGITTPRLTVNELEDAFDVSLGVETISILYTIGLSVVILSTVVPIGYVVTLNPKKVLLD